MENIFMEKKSMIFLLIILLCILVFQIKDKPVIKGGSMVGKMRVNGSSNKVVKDSLKNIMQNTDYYVINLPQETSNYLSKMDKLKPNYKNNKKYIMYVSDFDNNINCPYGQAFQRALQEAKSNVRNFSYFDFYTKPVVTYMPRKEVEKHIKIFGHAPTDVMTEDEAAPALDFHKTCGAFCIINPKTNHVISFVGVGEDKALKLQNLLDYLKTYNW
jgi:hypothetical protein